MPFKTHLFISYTHIDNLPTPDDKLGWVTRFHEYLESYLSRRLGDKANIWRDDRLRGDDVFANQIVKQLPDTAVLLSILSPRYLESEWCLKEVNQFCETAQANGGLTIDDKARVLRAMLAAIPSEEREKLPEILRGSLGYEFYEVVKGGRELPLDPSFGNGESYRRQIYFLADDIAKLLKNIDRKQVSPDDPAKPTLSTIYLAECGYDMREAREKIRGELRGLGYTVLPDQLTRLPDTEAAYTSEVNGILEGCDLSIHMMGELAGKILDGPARKSVVELQNEIAAESSRQRGLRRVIWLPDGLSSTHPEHEAFIQNLQKKETLQLGADLVRSGLEALKRVIYDALRKLQTPAEPVRATAVKLIYLICDQKDRSASLPLRAFLLSRGFEVKIPAFEGDSAAVRKANDSLLAECHAVLLFYGAGGETWKRAVDTELIKMRGYRQRPLHANFTYLAAPATDDKSELIALNEPNLIQGFDGMFQTECEPLLKALEN